MAKYAHPARIIDGIVEKRSGYLYYVDRYDIVMETRMKRGKRSEY